MKSLLVRSTKTLVGGQEEKKKVGTWKKHKNVVKKIQWPLKKWCIDFM